MPKKKPVKKELPKFVMTKETSKPRTFDTAWDEKFIDDGWVKLLGYTDISEWIIVYVRRGIIMFIRGSLGSYSAGKQTFSVMFDDSGMRFPKLHNAENFQKRMMA
jgi:hypothetical protein